MTGGEIPTKPGVAPSFMSQWRAPRLPLGWSLWAGFLRMPTKFHVGVRRECRKDDCVRKLVAIMVIEGVGYSRMMDEKRGGEAQAGWRAAYCPICHTLAFVYGVALSWRWAVMRLVSLGPRFAAEVRGVDLMDVATNDAAYRAVREAFEEHSVICFAIRK